METLVLTLGAIALAVICCWGGYECGKSAGAHAEAQRMFDQLVKQEHEQQ